MVVLLPSLAAQERKYVFTRLSVKDGLASNRVYSILQDRKGFMWFGTTNGLQRYDGRKIVMFRPPANPGEFLPATEISQIFEDVHHNFWVRSGGTVGIFDPVTFRFRKAAIITDSEIPPRAQYILSTDRRGNIFLVITGLCILVYDPGKNEFRKNDAIIRTPPGWKVDHLVEDPQNGNYWIGADSGIALYDISSKQVYCRSNNPHKLPILEEPAFSAPVTAIFPDRQNRFWIVTWGRNSAQHFYCYDRTSNSFLADTAGLYTRGEYYKELWDFKEQKNGKIWAYGLMMLQENDQSKRRFNYIRDEHIDDHGIKYDYVFCIYEDREENLWLGTDEGLYVFNPTREKFNSVNVYETGPVTKSASVTSFQELNNGNLMLGTWGSGTRMYDSNFNLISNKVLQYAPAGDGNFAMQWDICRDPRSGKIWIGCQSGRLIIYDPVTNSSRFYIVPMAEGRTIRKMTIDAKGNIWVATNHGLLLRWNPAAGYGTNFLNGFKVMQTLNTIVYQLKTDSDGFLWACTHMKGVYKVNASTGNIAAHYSTKSVPGRTLYSDMANDIVQYNDSLFFITAKALHLLNKNTDSVRQITTDDGLPSNNAQGLVMDNDNNIWVSLLNGVCRYNYRRNTFTIFAQKDGIIEEDYYGGIKMRNNKIVFGKKHGFIYFQPNLVSSISAPPLDVTITDFKLFNTYLPPDSIMKLDKVRLNYTQNSITIEFAALSFLQRDKIFYYYKLDGINKDWVRNEHGLFVNYTLLPPGNYTFHVMAINADGLESKNITRLRIYISPPFWRTWWFMAFIVLCIGALIYFIHRLRVNRLLAMEKVRTRIARDLHDDMGSTLSTINILSEMAKMKVNNDSLKTGEYLEKISDNSSRMMDAMDDIVWSINPMNDSMQRITARMREFATGVLEAKNIDFTFRVDDLVQDLKLDMEARRDIFLLFKEAVNNLAKYSRCKHASIDIFIQKNILLLKIQDDGIGFDTGIIDGGNGLTNMRKRAQSLNGELEIESKKQVGTKVLLQVPLT